MNLNKTNSRIDKTLNNNTNSRHKMPNKWKHTTTYEHHQLHTEKERGMIILRIYF